jgi:hypothetical protein
VHVVPDVVTIFGESHPGFYAALVIMGLKNSLLVHQPITNFSLPIIDKVDKMLYTYSDTQQDTIASGGNLIITQDSVAEYPYVRHQLTTNVDDLKHREISMTENYDDITYGILEVLTPFVGRYNSRPGVLAQIRTNLTAYLASKQVSQSTLAGPQITDFTINSMVLVDDQLTVDIRLFQPAPINYIDVTLTV